MARKRQKRALRRHTNVFVYYFGEELTEVQRVEELTEVQRVDVAVWCSISGTTHVLLRLTCPSEFASTHCAACRHLGVPVSFHAVQDFFFEFWQLP